MKILVCGDIHCKPEILEKAVLATKWDKFVFLGDLCDNWGATQNDNVASVKTIISLKEQYGDSFVWLMGNHDWGYYDTTIRMTGHIHSQEASVYHLLAENKDKWELIHFEGKYIFSHAGLSADFIHFTENVPLAEMKNIIGYENPVNMVGRACGGDDPAPSFLWARPSEFVALPETFGNIQVVGHTPVEKITVENGLVICDTFSQYPNGEYVGDKSLLLIDTDKDTMTAINLDGKELYAVGDTRL